MSERLLDGLEAAFGARGIDCERDGSRLRIADSLTIEPRATRHNDTQVQVEFAIESPRLAGVPLLDTHAGAASAPGDAEVNALDKFLQGSFDVVVEALTPHGGASDEVDWEDWRAEGHAWRVCAGPLLCVATRTGARIQGFAEFFSRLEEAFVRNVGAGPHSIRVFLGAVDGENRGSEVLVDGVPWPVGQELLEIHDWSFPEGYASLRLLAIALPAGP
jgi:hypothetical protein